VDGPDSCLGLAIGAGAVIGTLAAYWTVRRLGSFHSLARTVAAFVAAFVFYQLSIYVAAMSMLGGTEAFSIQIISQVLVVNAVTLVGLLGLYQLIAGATSLSRRRRAREVPARLA
jgi:hypothetical protein